MVLASLFFLLSGSCQLCVTLVSRLSTSFRPLVMGRPYYTVKMSVDLELSVSDIEFFDLAQRRV
jgi:hypothetical protein